MMRLVATVAICVLTAAIAEAKIAITDDMRFKDKDGVTYFIVLDCPLPGNEKLGGSEDSKIGNDRCGKCLIESNWGVYLQYPYDLMIKGTMVDEKGKPLANQLIHFFLPNGWTVKTRSTDTGFFRILMGATTERKANKMQEMDLGNLRMKKDSGRPYYALYMLPENFKPCAPEKAAK